MNRALLDDALNSFHAPLVDRDGWENGETPIGRVRRRVIGYRIGACTKPFSSGQDSMDTRPHPDVGKSCLEVQCWCGAYIVKVEAEKIRKGETAPCRRGCFESEYPPGDLVGQGRRHRLWADGGRVWLPPVDRSSSSEWRAEVARVEIGHDDVETTGRVPLASLGSWESLGWYAMGDRETQVQPVTLVLRSEGLGENSYDVPAARARWLIELAHEAADDEKREGPHVGLETVYVGLEHLKTQKPRYIQLSTRALLALADLAVDAERCPIQGASRGH